LRLFFALIVVWSHGIAAAGLPHGEFIWDFSHGAEDGGALAVNGFFLLSGFLITRSYESVGSLPRYLWHRFLRIFPAYWVCLIVTVLVVAPSMYVKLHGSISGYIGSPNQPLSYVYGNAFLHLGQPLIDHLTDRLPHNASINASLWTLQFEFTCYLLIGLIGFAGILRTKPRAVLSVTAALFLMYAIPLCIYGPRRPDAFTVLGEFLFFFIGSTSYLYRNRIVINGWIAVCCLVGSIISLRTRFCPAVVPVCLSYAIMFVAMNWPPRSFDRKVDLSYGVYIYAFPIQQLLMVYGLGALGFAPYLGTTLGITGSLAVMSWFLVERPSLSLKNARWDRRSIALLNHHERNDVSATARAAPPISLE
jgi:peptidoglycan/LPS O-acetylase OafA/YrhL